MFKKVAGVLVAVAPMSAFAAVPPAVITAITDATADGSTIAFALLTFAIAVGVILYLKRKAG